MRNWIYLHIVIFIFIVTLPLAQEDINQYLQNIKGPTIDDYIQILNEGSREDKLLAIDILSKSGSKNDAIINALISCLGEGTLFVKRRAGTVINDFWDVRARSAEVLGEIGDPCALPHLHMVLLRDPDPVVRCCAATAIGKIGQPESIRFLALAIKTTNTTGSNATVILSCVRALGDIGHPDAFLPLYEVARSGYSSNIELAARNALQKIRWE